MKNPILLKATIPASGTAYSSSIQLIRTRGLSITGRCTFNASGTKDATVKIFYSPDGTNWDTDAYASFTLAVDAGNTVQSTSYAVMPEHGYAKFAVSNGDTSYSITDVKVWYSIQSWSNGEVQSHGEVSTSLEAD